MRIPRASGEDEKKTVKRVEDDALLRINEGPKRFWKRFTHILLREGLETGGGWMIPSLLCIEDG